MCTFNETGVYNDSEEENWSHVVDFEGRGYKICHNDMWSTIYEPLMKSQLSNLNEAKTLREVDTTKETLSIHLAIYK